MKVCESCGEDIDGTRDGETRCQSCENIEESTDERKKRAAQQRRERASMLRSLGLVKVRGALGGTYWE